MVRVEATAPRGKINSAAPRPQTTSKQTNHVNSCLILSTVISYSTIGVAALTESDRR